nr:MAG TPA: hypothetical protein [Caudoviricetes sp.]DAY34133.1 MAG TPA: hypothetical protein [Caudoviricetes sp.]
MIWFESSPVFSIYHLYFKIETKNSIGSSSTESVAIITSASE